MFVLENSSCCPLRRLSTRSFLSKVGTFGARSIHSNRIFHKSSKRSRVESAGNMQKHRSGITINLLLLRTYVASNNFGDPGRVRNVSTENCLARKYSYRILKNVPTTRLRLKFCNYSCLLVVLPGLLQIDTYIPTYKYL